MVPEGFVRALDGFEVVPVATPEDRWLSPSRCEGWSAMTWPVTSWQVPPSAEDRHSHTLIEAVLEGLDGSRLA